MTPARSSLAALVVLLILATAGCGGSAKVSAQSSAAGWQTWAIRSPASISVPPPPAKDSAAANRDAAELQRLSRRRPAGAAAAMHRWNTEPVVGPWVELNLELVAGRTAVDPPLASRSYALVSAAINDAVVAASYWQKRYHRAPPPQDGAVARVGTDASYPSENAAVAGAASRVLAYLFPERRDVRFESLAHQAAWSRVWAGTSYPSDVQAGLALGRAVADTVIARARLDRVSAPWNRKRPHGPGLWEPPLGTHAQPVEPMAGSWHTWVLRSGAQLRPGPPPRYGSPIFLAQARELMRLRRHLSPEQKRIAKFWEGGVGTSLPPGVWNEVALAYVRRDRLDTAHAAHVFALLNIAMADTAVAVWDTKYHYWSPRPENAIRGLGLDRTWSPFLPNPPFPSYVSAHSAYSAAAAEVLAHAFPRDAKRFRAKAEEAGLSRLYGGIHYRADHVIGMQIGRMVGALVLERAEPTGSGAN